MGPFNYMCQFLAVVGLKNHKGTVYAAGPDSKTQIIYENKSKVEKKEMLAEQKKPIEK